MAIGNDGVMCSLKNKRGRLMEWNCIENLNLGNQEYGSLIIIINFFVHPLGLQVIVILI